MTPIEIYIQHVEGASDIPLPSFQTEHSACADLHACVEKDTVLEAGSYALIPTGLKMEIPIGYELQIRARSGLSAKQGIGLMNGVGTIDSDFRGEVKIILFNFGKDPLTIHRGDRIAQCKLSLVLPVRFAEKENLTTTTRGEGGFGHTGLNSDDKRREDSKD